MKKRNFPAVILLAFAATNAIADEGPVVGVGASRLGVDDIDLSFTLLHGTVGYRFDSGDVFSFTPELRFGVGVTDDDFAGVNFDVDGFYGFGVRGEIEAANAYVFVTPTYTNFELKGSFGGITASEDDWSFGVGIGAGMNLGRDSSIEISYETIEDADAFSIGVRFDF